MYFLSFTLNLTICRIIKFFLDKTWLFLLSSWRGTIFWDFLPSILKRSAIDFTLLFTTYLWTWLPTLSWPERFWIWPWGEVVWRRKGSDLLSDPDISKALLGHQNDLSSAQHPGPEQVCCAPWLTAGHGELIAIDSDLDSDLQVSAV